MIHDLSLVISAADISFDLITRSFFPSHEFRVTSNSQNAISKVLHHSHRESSQFSIDFNIHIYTLSKVLFEIESL
jgi:hypothetical protein